MIALCAIDLGSNALRCAVGTFDLNGALVGIETERASVRLGHDVFTTRRISEESIQRSCEAIRNFIIFARERGVTSIDIVATSAVREAHNREQLLSAIHRETGLVVNLIDGLEEARLISVAVQRHVDLKSSRAVILDIGGGSCEISLVDDGEVAFSDSLLMGTVRLLPLLKDPSVGPKLIDKFITSVAKGTLNHLTQETKKRNVDLFVNTGGNIDSIISMRDKIFGVKPSRLVALTELTEIISTLEKLSIEERINTFGFRKDRADVIYPATLILRAVMSSINASELLAPGVGLREGVLVDLYSRMRQNSALLVDQHIKMSAELLGRKYHYEEEHAHTVSRIAEMLFLSARDLHHLDERNCLLLSIAALLHDVGHFVAARGHHKHSFYLIQSSPLTGLSSREMNIIANVARYHRKSHPSMEHKEFASISDKDKEIVSKLAALLRLADALDRSHESIIESVTLKKTGNGYVLTAKGSGDFNLERWALERKKDLFESVFSTVLSISI